MEGEVEDEDLIQREDVVVTVSHRGYIKRVPLSTYRAQRRGGKGRSGMSTREEDVVTQIFVASTHTPVLFFSSRGMAYRMKVWRLPAATPQSVGKALVNLLPLAEGEIITSILPLPEDAETWGTLELMFATKSGNVRRNSLADFESINRNGKIAMKLDEGDRIVRVAICTARRQRAAHHGAGPLHPLPRRRRAPVQGPRLHGRARHPARRGRRGHLHGHPAPCRGDARRARRLPQAGAGRCAAPQGAEVAEGAAEADAEAEEGAEAASSSRPSATPSSARSEQFVLTVSERGFGKRSSSYEYRISGRGGKGITAMIVNERNGRLVASFPVEDSDQIMLVTDGGKLIRCPVDDVRIAGAQHAGRAHLQDRGRARRSSPSSASPRTATATARTATARPRRRAQ